MKKVVIGILLALVIAVNAGVGASERTKIQVLSWWSITDGSPLDVLKGAFEEANPEIELEFITIPASGYYEKLLTMVAGRRPPDVAMLAMDWLAVFIYRNALEDLTPYFERDYYMKEDLFPVVYESMQSDGRIYAMPRDTTSNALMYNTRMFKEAGVAPPEKGWTWEDFLEACAKLTKVDSNGRTVQWGFHFPSYMDGWYDWVLQNNGNLFAEDYSGTLINTPETIEALQFLVNLRYKYGYAPTLAQAQEFGTSGTSPFVAQKVGMYIGGASRVLTFLGVEDLEFAVAPLPKGKREASRIFTNYWVVPRGTRNVEAAWKFVNWFAGPEGQRLAMQTNMGISALRSVAETEESFLAGPPEGMENFIEAFYTGVNFPQFPEQDRFSTIMTRELDLVWLGQKSVDEATKAIEEATEVLFQ